MSVKKPWVEAHRPVSLDEVIFSDDRLKAKFKHIVDTGDLPNLLIYGPPGTGKTTVSKALLRDLDIDTMDRLRINCSDEKIDAMRDKVRAFASTMPLGRLHLGDGPADPRPEFKVVQLEEFDYLSLDAQALLRSLIEDTSSTCRFIATCNYVNKVIPALRSRFQEVEFKAPDAEAVAVRCAEILEGRSITFALEDLDAVVSAGYPDIRKTITMLEQFSTSGTLTISTTSQASDWKLSLLPLLDTGDFRAARKVVCESATKEELVDVYRFLYDNITKLKTLKGKHDQAVVLIAQYQYQHAFVSDPEIQIAALFIELGNL